MRVKNIVTGKVKSFTRGQDGYVDIILDSNGQTVKALYANGLIQAGTEATIVSDEMNNFYCIGTRNKGADVVVDIMIEFMEAVKDMQTVDEGSAHHPTTAGKGTWGHDKVDAIVDIISKLNKFK